MTSGRISHKDVPVLFPTNGAHTALLGKRVFVDLIEGLDLGRLSSITMALMIGSPVRIGDAVMTEAEME